MVVNSPPTWIERKMVLAEICASPSVMTEKPAPDDVMTIPCLSVGMLQEPGGGGGRCGGGVNGGGIDGGGGNGGGGNGIGGDGDGGGGNVGGAEG